jgi:hypothetical protein
MTVSVLSFKRLGSTRMKVAIHEGNVMRKSLFLITAAVRGFVGLFTT